VYHAGGGLSSFSLWTDRTAIDLFSAGGDLTPITAVPNINTSTPLEEYFDHSATDGRHVYPSKLRAVAAGGSLYFGQSILFGYTAERAFSYSLLLAPSTTGQGQLEFLAADSIYGGTASRSGADPSVMPTPWRPAFLGLALASEHSPLTVVASNYSPDGIAPGGYVGKPYGARFPLFAFGSPSTAALDWQTSTPSRFYALNGDIVGLRTGGIETFISGPRKGQIWYEGSGPVHIVAGRDIVSAGTSLGTALRGAYETSNQRELGSQSPPNSWITGSLIVHGDATDISVVSAGRDILRSHFAVAGPGLLEVSAGRNILQEDKASFVSVGSVAGGAQSGNSFGAGITVSAGLGAAGADYAGLLDRYLGAANQSVAGIPLADQPGKVAKVYDRELQDWLAERFGFTGTAEEARAYLAGLPAKQQRVFARMVYFAELKAGGREYNDPASSRYGSYLRGRQMIATLFPEQDASGAPITYRGELVMFGDAGIQTQFGGDIQVLTPGGGQIYGIEGEAPKGKLGTPGVITQGRGNIQLYSLGSILLGQSRIMTTFGGDIQAWSARGDINAGRGSKTTLVYTPPKREYDQYGNVTLSPSVPSTGAGIATLNPIPEVPPGSIDLIAPLGTIDAGEAGIRVSGDINIAALQVVNAANIQVQGNAVGVPVAPTTDTGAMTAASNTAGTAASAASEAAGRSRQGQPVTDLPSIITVQVIGYGGDDGDDAGRAGENRREESNAAPQRTYNPNSAFQVVGAGKLTDEQQDHLTESERRMLGQ
jgi:hypothetical protein